MNQDVPLKLKSNQPSPIPEYAPGCDRTNQPIRPSAVKPNPFKALLFQVRQMCGVISTMLCLSMTVWGQSAEAIDDKSAVGFLFIDGRYIAPPYIFRMHEDQVLINDVVLTTENLVTRNQDDRRQSRNDTGSRRPPWRRLSQLLETGATVLLFENRRPIIFDGTKSGFELLTLLVDDDARQQAATVPPDWLPDVLPTGEWQRYFAEIRLPPAFFERAKLEINRIERIEATNGEQKAAVRRHDSLVYALNILGMVLVALSLGHLLSNRPVMRLTKDVERLSPEESRGFFVSLILVCVLSGLDLVWTILLPQTGLMKELNPLGSHLIQAPQKLMIFKIAATAVAVGLLFACRKALIARRASWWACLIYTLLAVRWLTFNSMFLS